MIVKLFSRTQEEFQSYLHHACRVENALTPEDLLRIFNYALHWLPNIKNSTISHSHKNKNIFGFLIKKKIFKKKIH